MYRKRKLLDCTSEHLGKVLLERMNEGQGETTPNGSTEDLRRLIKEELAVQEVWGHSGDQYEADPLSKGEIRRGVWDP